MVELPVRFGLALLLHRPTEGHRPHKTKILVQPQVELRRINPEGSGRSLLPSWHQKCGNHVCGIIRYMITELGKKIIALREDGLSYRQIKAQLGCSSASVAYWSAESNRQTAQKYGRDRRSASRKFLQEVKQSSPCVDCGENYPYWMMDFDHLGDKSFNVSRSSGKTIEQLKEEIAKCELVCANCHRNRTYMRLIKHGADAMDISSDYR